MAEQPNQIINPVIIKHSIITSQNDEYSIDSDEYDLLTRNDSDSEDFGLFEIKQDLPPSNGVSLVKTHYPTMFHMLNDLNNADSESDGLY